MKAVIIKGNPKFIMNDLARQYYADIQAFLEDLGVEVILDEGKDFTCPPKADFYVAHSRGCGRVRCFENKPNELRNFLKFGDPDGIIHPVDAKWQADNPPGTPSRPPKEHFEFTEAQQNAIRSKVDELRRQVSNESFKRGARQRPSTRYRG